MSLKVCNPYFLTWLLDEEARPQRRNRSRRRRNRGNRPEGGSTSRDRQPAENGKSACFSSHFSLQEIVFYINVSLDHLLLYCLTLGSFVIDLLFVSIVPWICIYTVCGLKQF